jgi:tetratricopeptide (TPR) repeat protein
LGREHPDTLDATGDLAATYSAQGDFAGAQLLYSEAVEISRRVLGAEHPPTLSLRADFGWMYQRQGKYDLAGECAAMALAGQRHTLGSEHPDTMTTASNLALTYIAKGQFTEAEPLAREALVFDRKKQPDDWQRFRAESLLGASLAGQKKYIEAEPLLLNGYQGMAERKQRISIPDRYHLERAQEWIVQLYRAWGKPEKAAEWRGRRA